MKKKLLSVLLAALMLLSVSVPAFAMGDSNYPIPGTDFKSFTFTNELERGVINYVEDGVTYAIPSVTVTGSTLVTYNGLADSLDVDYYKDNAKRADYAANFVSNKFLAPYGSKTTYDYGKISSYLNADGAFDWLAWTDKDPRDVKSATVFDFASFLGPVRFDVNFVDNVRVGAGSKVALNYLGTYYVSVSDNDIAKEGFFLIVLPEGHIRTTKNLANPALRGTATKAEVFVTTTRIGQTRESVASALSALSGDTVTVNTLVAQNLPYFTDLLKRSTNVSVEAGVELYYTRYVQVGINYEIQAGDTLAGIAYNYYGKTDAATIKKISDANALYLLTMAAKGVTLQAGDEIYLPAGGMMNPLSGYDAKVYSQAGLYLVKSGDSFESIAKAFYGDAKYASKITGMNSGRIAKDGKAVAGQWIRIPCI